MDPRQTRAALQRLVGAWDARIDDSRDHFSYRLLLDELFFHSDLRFEDYIQFRETEGAFPVRLARWLDNVSREQHKQLLFRLLRRLIFVDRLQMQSLYRDAYRRVIAQWLQTDLTAAALLDPSLPAVLAKKLRRYPLYSITESFAFPEFLHVNHLVGLEKPTVLGDKPARVGNLIPGHDADIDGLIIFEDVVGSGTQAARVLAEVRRRGAESWRYLFVPLIMFEVGRTTLQKKLSNPPFSVAPVFVVADSYCIHPQPRAAEPSEFTALRTLARDTFPRVRERLNSADVPPGNAFGYKGSGGLLVTFHNAPNNSLPLLHHKAPTWSALFRRLHHLTS